MPSRLRGAALLTLVLALLFPERALAHQAEGSGFGAGFFHPVSGVDHVLALLASDMRRTMALIGCATVKELDREYVEPDHGGTRL